MIELINCTETIQSLDINLIWPIEYPYNLIVQITAINIDKGVKIMTWIVDSYKYEYSECVLYTNTNVKRWVKESWHLISTVIGKHTSSTVYSNITNTKQTWIEYKALSRGVVIWKWIIAIISSHSQSWWLFLGRLLGGEALARVRAAHHSDREARDERVELVKERALHALGDRLGRLLEAQLVEHPERVERRLHAAHRAHQLDRRVQVPAAYATEPTTIRFRTSERTRV